jgi:hypothetical protein
VLGALLPEILNTLTNDEFIPHLANLLLYHVFAEVFAIDLFDDLIVTVERRRPSHHLPPPLPSTETRLSVPIIDVQTVSFIMMVS